MATDLDVTTAVWGTADLLLASGDPIDDNTGSAWGGQVAQNTGVLYYLPRPIASGGHLVRGGDPLDAYYGYTYLQAGTYSIYGYGTSNAPSMPVGSLTFDGSNLVVWSGTGAPATGSFVGWTTAARWVLSRFVGSAVTGTNTTISVGITYRLGSFAP